MSLQILFSSFPPVPLRALSCLLLLIAPLPQFAVADGPYHINWGRQFGTQYLDAATGVAVDEHGNAYVAGTSHGVLGGTGFNNTHAFLTKYDAAGNQLWMRQDSAGTNDVNEMNVALGASYDGLGHAYLAGIANTSVGDCCNYDPYLSKYDSDGSLVWTRVLSNDSGEESAKVAADGLGNIFLAGSRSGYPAGPINGSSDAFVAKFDEAGNLEWQQTFGGASSDEVYGMSTDGLGNVYIAGFQDFVGLGYQAYLTKFDTSGTQLWTSYLGADITLELAFGVHASPNGQVYLVGQTESDLATPPQPISAIEPFVAQFDDSGQLQWAKVLDTNSGFARATGVTADEFGIVHVVGYSSAESTKGFVEMLAADGTSLGRLTVGNGDHASFSSVSGRDGVLYAAGGTRDSLFASFAGESDAFIMRLHPIPEPNSFVLAALAGSLIGRRARRTVA